MSVRKTIVDIISNFANSNIDTSHSISEYGIDSLTLTELSYEIEDSLNVTIKDSDWHSFKTIDDLIVFVEKAKT